MSELRANNEESASTPEVHRRRARERVSKTRSAPVRAWLAQRALRAVALLGYPTLYRLGGLVGAALARLPTRERAVTATNLELCLPELDERERRRLLRASLVETGRTFVEFAPFWCWPAERALALVRETVGLELFERARADGRPLILVAPHLGAWELCGIYLSALAPTTALYKRPPIAEMEAFYTAGRGRLGAKLAPADATGVAALARALRSREAVFILPDQDPGRGSGVFVPFFGVPASTSTLVAKLAARSGALVLLTWAERLPRAAGFRLHLVAPRREIGDADDVRGTIALNAEIADLVRTAPRHYLWSYKRFRTRPPGQQDPYRFGINAQTVGDRA